MYIRSDIERRRAIDYVFNLADSITDTEHPGLVLDDEGPYELLTCDLPILAKNPSIPLDAEAFVDFALFSS